MPRKPSQNSSVPEGPVEAASAGRELAGKYDVLKLPPPAAPPKLSRLKIGIHTSTSGGVETSAERAYRLGCNAFQIFSSSPRMWAPFKIGQQRAEAMRRFRAQYQIAPLAIHTSYLVNLCSATPEFLRKSIVAFRGEVERGLALGAEFLVLHPGSFRGKTRAEGLACAADSIAKAVEGMDLEAGKLRILIENTAGAEFSLGGSFDQVAELLERLRVAVPVGACIDTCHTHVSGYDIVTAEGYTATMKSLDETVGLANVLVWHCNDAKSAFGSKLDRHQHIGQGTIGIEPFRRLLNDPRTQHAAFIAETPIDEPGDDQRNVDSLKNLVD